MDIFSNDSDNGIKTRGNKIYFRGIKPLIDIEFILWYGASLDRLLNIFIVRVVKMIFLDTKIPTSQNINLKVIFYSKSNVHKAKCIFFNSSTITNLQGRLLRLSWFENY